ncbi:hypothetical protein GOV08_02465 [Candidatus Woesearchaeota archaeon]|nr:hypothetical protein [Candidatus Woesearchaeota archaeon]
MKRIFLDTNFLLIPAQLKVDIFAEIARVADFDYQLCVLEQSIDELKKMIATQKGKTKDFARIALQMIKQKSLYITPFSKSGGVDDILVELSDEKTVVATQDKELKKRIKEKGSNIITLKNKKYLEII